MNHQASLTAVALTLALALAACSPTPAATDAVETGSVLLEVPPASIRSPDGTMTLLFGGETDPSLTLSAGFMKRTPIGTVETTSRLSWAPDSRHFFVNDSGSAAWSAFRLWSARRGSPRESSTLRQAAIDALARLNGCGAVPAEDVTTWGMGWLDGGKRVLVLAEVRRTTGDCAWGRVGNVLLVADPADGKVFETLVEGEARSRYPTLEWTPVTEP